MKNELLICGLAVWLTSAGLGFGHRAEGDHGRGRSERREGTVYSVPDTGVGWLAVPLLGGVLLYHWRRRAA